MIFYDTLFFGDVLKHLQGGKSVAHYSLVHFACSIAHDELVVSHVYFQNIKT